MPQELQNMLLQNPQIQQMAQAIEMQKQNGEEVPAQIPDASIPQAQPME
jgi:chaperonin cofactor prefoldin